MIKYKKKADGNNFEDITWPSGRERSEKIHYRGFQLVLIHKFCKE